MIYQNTYIYIISLSFPSPITSSWLRQAPTNDLSPILPPPSSPFLVSPPSPRPSTASHPFPDPSILANPPPHVTRFSLPLLPRLPYTTNPPINSHSAHFTLYLFPLGVVRKIINTLPPSSSTHLHFFAHLPSIQYITLFAIFQDFHAAHSCIPSPCSFWYGMSQLYTALF